MVKRTLFSLVLALSTPALSQVVPPANDVCIAAELLEPGVPIRADNSNSNVDYINQGTCGARSDRFAVWYEIKATGGRVTVNVCTNNGVITDYGVFPECNSQECVASTPQMLQPFNCSDDEFLSLSFDSKRNRYFVHVRSEVVDGVGSDFNISYTETGGTPETDPPSVESGSPNAASYAVVKSTFMALSVSAMALVFV